MGENEYYIDEEIQLTDVGKNHIETMDTKERHFNLFILLGVLLGISGCAFIGISLVLDLPERHIYQGFFCIFIGTFLTIDLIRNRRSLGIIRKLLEERMPENR